MFLRIGVAQNKGGKQNTGDIFPVMIRDHCTGKKCACSSPRPSNIASHKFRLGNEKYDAKILIPVHAMSTE